MSTLTAKSFVLNNGMVNMAKSHIVQLFKPSYNPADDEKLVAPTGHFKLQHFTTPLTGTDQNPIPNIYKSKNIVSGMFLVTENFITMMNQLNNILYSGTLQKEITPITYTYDIATGFTAEADTSNTDMIVNAFNGPVENIGSLVFNKIEKDFTLGIVGAGTQKGMETTQMAIKSSSVTELFLRHLYSKDPGKRQRAFAFAKSFYGINANLVDSIVANNEMIPAENYNSEKLVIKITEDIIKFQYDTPIKFTTKYNEAINNPTNKKLYLYFPFITSNATRRNDKALYDYRESLISLYTGPKDTFKNHASYNAQAGITNILSSYIDNSTVTYRNESNIYTNHNMPTLTNTLWSKIKNKVVDQAGYTALRITQVGGGGDIQFDYIDKIDYIDSLTIEIKAPTVFS
jgi:hypothetical protein